MRKIILIKTICNFIAIFIVFLLGSYFWAALNDNHSVKRNERPIEKVKKSPVKLTTPKVARIKTQGLARYIGVSSAQIEQDFGEPQAKMDSANNVQWWLYDLDSTNYLKIGIDQYNKKVSDVFVAGSTPDQPGSLRVGMTFEKLLQLTSLYANFELSYHEQKFQFELSEADLNQRPLLGFKNGSYAIIYINPSSQKIDAIEYLNTDMLLKKNIYRVVSKTPLPVEYQGNTDWDQMDIMLPFDLMQLINTKRRLTADQVLSIGDPLVQTAHKVIEKLDERPRAYLSAQNANLLKKVTSGDVGQQRELYLHNRQIPKKLYNDVELDEKKYKIYSLLPYYDNSVFFEKLRLRQSLWKAFVSERTKNIGIAYDRGILVVIINK
ncbi:CAP-associated domain-containing protein [Liquorilactobacillus oeni]|uniref:CAP-associated domain-containing protein n=1 Tax=Liquorilactobacillus oeni DSM 19972 TaxID=1423777 RepID=A0A0R1M8Y3_9LACO|nr:CAP-associated domain-containing protein [Liquorilactobacillus oeni]KRL04640.1 hypothetical protein FD46_GL001773 [Liquorilactobacillus oeni DSM 19972]